MKASLFFLFLSVLVLVRGQDDDLLQVHVVPHTHDDVGWLKTVDQYYMGSNNSIQHAGVQYIIDSVYLALKANPERRFSYVEMAFFIRWFREQTDGVKSDVKHLVDEGRLGFMNGGWCMHDEANTHYLAMIDQTTLGHQHIAELFGEAALPRVGWQIDPFGHSATQGSYMTYGFGFDGLVVGRIDYQDRALRTNESRLETLWQPLRSIDQQIFLSCDIGGNYQPPAGLCFDQFCADPPVQDDPRLFDYNVQERVDLFVQRAQEQANATLGNQIIFKMGSDFQYENANEWFKNLDKLIQYVNEDGRVHAFYSTPTKYIESKLSGTWPLKTDDFFPYADGAEAYWTGYFTSRPTVKGFVRHSSSTLQAAKQLLFWTSKNVSTPADLTTLEEAVAVAQHHDAVAGTEKQHVASDYSVRLASGLSQAEPVMSQALSQLMGDSELDFTQCQLLNVSVCPGSASQDGFMVVLYNPSSARRIESIERIPVNGPNFEVFSSDGEPIPSTILPTFQTTAVQKEESSLSHTLFFEANMEAMGWNTYFVMPSGNAIPPKEGTGLLENDHFVVHFNDAGEIQGIFNKKTQISTPFESHFEFYESFNHTEGSNDTQNSGAYIFRPAQNYSHPISAKNDSSAQFYETTVVSEVRKEIQPWIYRTYRLGRTSPYLEVEYTIGPIPIDDKLGKEVITKYQADVESKDTFYTDSNGREMQERILNYRPTWNVSIAQPVAGNYYPINAAAYIKDDFAQLSFVNDRSQGGSSLASGAFEFMLHRRILNDDSRGVGEPLNETESITPYPDPQRVGYGLNVTTLHRISFESSSPNLPGNGNDVMREMMSNTFHKTQYFFSSLPDSPFDWAQTRFTKGTRLGSALPFNVQIETLQTLPTRQPEQQKQQQEQQAPPVLLRLGHKFAVGESPSAVPVQIDINSIFSPYLEVTSIEEKNLAGMPLRKISDWKTTGQPSPLSPSSSCDFSSSLTNSTVEINPMEILTFLVHFD